MNFCIDIGNTRAKLGFFKEGKLVELHLEDEPKALSSHLKKASFQSGIISSVRNLNPIFLEEIKQFAPLLILKHGISVPIHNHYESPQTLGLDRLAGVVGANYLFPDNSCLVIDLGTCITFDLVDQEANYWGGNISPGLKMRFKAMHNFTDRLPLLELKASKPSEILAKNTEMAMQMGVQLGIQMEIESYYHRLKSKYPKLKLILSGGEAQFFESRLKEPIFAFSELNLIGLNRILEYNAN